MCLDNQETDREIQCCYIIDLCPYGQVQNWTKKTQRWEEAAYKGSQGKLRTIDLAGCKRRTP